MTLVINNSGSIKFSVRNNKMLLEFYQPEIDPFDVQINGKKCNFNFNEKCNRDYGSIYMYDVSLDIQTFNDIQITDSIVTLEDTILDDNFKISCFSKSYVEIKNFNDSARKFNNAKINTVDSCCNVVNCNIRNADIEGVINEKEIIFGYFNRKINFSGGNFDNINYKGNLTDIYFKNLTCNSFYANILNNDSSVLLIQKATINKILIDAKLAKSLVRFVNVTCQRLQLGNKNIWLQEFGFREIARIFTLRPKNYRDVFVIFSEC